MPHDFNQKIIEEFRANSGQVTLFEGGRLILLTTIGRRTGVPRTTPVAYLPDKDRILIVASAGGAPRHPDWFYNLVANPEVTVETGFFTYRARAVVLEGAERDEMFARAVEADSRWAEYQAKTSRVIPVVALYETEMINGPAQASSWGAGLKLIHDALRREFALIRKEVAESGPRVGVQLRVNCLTACHGLHYHHTSEDATILPFLAEHRPDLASVLERVAQEHQKIAALLEELQRVLTDDTLDRSPLISAVERLTAEVEAHLAYEEEQLIPALDALSS